MLFAKKDGQEYQATEYGMRENFVSVGPIFKSKSLSKQLSINGIHIEKKKWTP